MRRIGLGYGSANAIRLEMAVKIVGYMHGEQNDGDLRLSFRDLLGGFEAVHHGHGNVHNDYVGLKLKRLFHCLLSVTSLRANTSGPDWS